ncbi:MAG: hypothetical protein AAFY46_04735, partial [Planctomycetota bacterium]
MRRPTRFRETVKKQDTSTWMIEQGKLGVGTRIEAVETDQEFRMKSAMCAKTASMAPRDGSG